MKKYLKFLLKLSVSLGFLVWIIFKTNWSQVLFYLKEIDLWKLIIYILILIFGMLISAYKWKLLAEFKNIRLSLWNFFRFYLTGTFINNFMPSFIGGDTYRAYQIGKTEKKYMGAASSVMADRITGLIGMTILALLFSLINLQTVLKSKILIIINLILIFSLLIDIVIAWTRNYNFWKKFINFIPQKIARFIFETQEYGGNSPILIKTVFLGMIFQVIGVALANYILFLVAGHKNRPGRPAYLAL